MRSRGDVEKRLMEVRVLHADCMLGARRAIEAGDQLAVEVWVADARKLLTEIDVLRWMLVGP